MVQRGRPTSAVSMVGRLKGTVIAKERTVVILENLGGALPVAEALRRTGMSRTLFHNLRMATLSAALRAVEPRPPGRPVREIPKHERRIRELEEKILQLDEDLAFTRVREELALLVPWTGHRQKKRRRPRACGRATVPSRPHSASRVGATPGPCSPGASA
jgi:hypothetical protein